MEALGLGAKLHAPLVVAFQKGAVEAVDPRSAGAALGCLGQAAENRRSVGRPRPSKRGGRRWPPGRTSETLPGPRAPAGRRRPLGELVETLEQHLEMTDRRRRAQGDRQAHRRAVRRRAQAARAGGRAWERSSRSTRRRRGAGVAGAAVPGGREPAASSARSTQRKIEITERADERRMLLLQSARIYDEKLGEPHRGDRPAARAAGREPGRRRGAGAPRSHPDRARGNSRSASKCSTRAPAERRTPPTATSSLSAPRAWWRPSSATSKAPSAVTAHPRRGAQARRGPRGALTPSPAAMTTACRRSPVLEPLLRAGQGLGGVIELLELRLAVEDASRARLDMLAEIAGIEERERQRRADWRSPPGPAP